MALHSSIIREWNCSALVLEYKRATPTLGEHLNKVGTWSEQQERSGSVAEAPRLTMPKWHSCRGSALVVARS